MQPLYPLIFALVLCLISTDFFAQTPNDDWPQQDGFSERAGRVQSNMTPPFRHSGTIDIGENIEAFVYSDDVIYFSFIGSIGRAFGAYSLSLDQVLWERAIPEAVGSVGCSPTVSGDLLYIGAQRGTGFYAVDKMTGDSIWFYPTQSNYGRPGAVKDDLLFLHPPGEGIVCLNKYTGEVLWKYGESSTQTVPMADDLNVYFTSRSSDTIYALTHDGEEAWKYRSPSGIDDFEGILSHGDTVFLKTRGHLVALDRSTGGELWITTLADSNSFISGYNAIAWSPKILVSHEWIGDWQDSFKIQGFNLTTGQMEWSHDLEPRSGACAVSFGNFLANINGGDLQIRNASDGEIIQEITGVNLSTYDRVRVVDGSIMASSGSRILVFTEMTTHTRNDDKQVTWNLIENPSFGNLVLMGSATRQAEAEYSVINMSGHITGISGHFMIDETPTQKRIDVSSLPAGKYILDLRSELGSEQLLFVKQ